MSNDDKGRRVSSENIGTPFSRMARSMSGQGA